MVIRIHKNNCCCVSSHEITTIVFYTHTYSVRVGEDALYNRADALP